MAKKLTKVKLTSVDFVNAGANQDADIKLYKSAGGQSMNEEEMKKSFFETVKAFFTGNGSAEDIEKARIEKAKDTIRNENELYTSTLQKSLDSIIFDDGLNSEQKLAMMHKSLIEFNETMADAVSGWSQLEKSITEETIKKARESQNGGGAEMALKINKSKLDANEQSMLEALLTKAKEEGDFADDDEVIVTEKEVEAKAGKGGPKKEDDTINKAFSTEIESLKKNIETLQKSNEMKDLLEVAKKYTILGKKEDELAETLYNMKKSSQATYDQYVSLLDESLSLVEKSGTFTEIGKSGVNRGYGGGSVEAKIESIASEIQKSDASLSRLEAVNKAWEQHPELIAEYERTYRG